MTPSEQWQMLALEYQSLRTYTQLHEKDRLSVLRSLERVAPLRDANRARRLAAIDRARRGRRATRRRWRVLPRSPLCAAARVTVSASRRGGSQDEPHRDRNCRHRHAVRKSVLY